MLFNDLSDFFTKRMRRKLLEKLHKTFTVSCVRRYLKFFLKGILSQLASVMRTSADYVPGSAVDGSHDSLSVVDEVHLGPLVVL